MTSIDLQFEGDACWPDLIELGKAGKVDSAELVGVALLPDAIVTRPDGTQARVPALTLRIALPDGRVGLAQIKVDMLNMVLRGVKGRLEYLADLARQGGTPS